MIRLRLAALILTAGLGFISGCSACYSFGRTEGGGGLFGGGLFGHNRNGSSVSALPDCCPVGVGGYPGVGDCCALEGGPMLAPPATFGAMPGPGMPGMPPAGVPMTPPPGMPMLTEPPLGSNTKFSPVPYSMPYPYVPAGKK